MSGRIIEAMSKSFWPAARSLLLIALLGLVGISLQQVFVVVVKSLLSADSWPNAFRAVVLVAAAIPLGFLIVCSCIALVIGGRQLWNLMSHQRRL